MTTIWAFILVVLATACSVAVRPDARFASPEAAIDTYIDALRRGAHQGDVELLVDETIAGKDYTFSYLLRKGELGWKIWSHSAVNDVE